MTVAETVNMLDAALSYAARGWQVFPCKPRSKAPRTSHGVKDATTDVDVIRRWWTASPEDNIAIRCGLASGGLVVVDIDGDEGRASIMGKKMPPTLIAKTGGGGCHYLYFHPYAMRPKVGLLTHVDIRADDSYIVAPPSIHPNGSAYEWLLPIESHVSTKLPEWVVEAMAAEAEPHAAEPVGEQIGKGGRNAALTSLGGTMRRRGMSKEAIESALQAENAAKCNPPLPVAEVKAIAESVCRYEPEEKRNGRNPGMQIHVISAPDLLKKVFPPVRYVVEGIIPEGAAILAAKPKLGKTWLCLDIALASAYGGIALGSKKVEQCSVLYMALEDGERRIKSRLQLMVDEMPDGFAPPNLTFAYNWPRIDEGGIEALIAWLDEHPLTKLIIVDTLKRIRPKEKGGRTLYSQDYEAVAPLTDLAHTRGISIITVMHTRKMEADDALDMVSGSLGITGAVDHILVLKRARNQGEATLQVIGRDTEEQELALLWKPPHWQLVGMAKDVRMSKERKEIVDCIHAGKDIPATPKDLADKLGKDIKQVRSLLWKMAQDNELVAMGGFYSVATANKKSEWGSI